MKFTNCILTTALASALCSLATSSVMAANVDIYGKANLSVQSSDDGDGKFNEIKSNASRIGFKGTHKLQDGLSVVYKAEFQVDMDGDSDDNISDRNQYIGLKGDFGEVLLGKNDTLLKQSQGKVDLFNDLNGDIKVLFKGDNRMSDSITYKSNKLYGFKFGMSYIAQDSLDGDNGYSVGILYGDAKLKKSRLFASVAIDSDVKGYDTTRATVQGKLSGVTLAAMLQTQEKNDSGAKMNGYFVSAKYGFDELTLKAQLQVADHEHGDKYTGASVGADYRLAKSTKVYAFYTSLDMDSKKDKDYLGVGIEYKF
jgi:predicted porin